jgi:hypothetical protein
MCVTAASGGPSLFTQYAPSAILKSKNRKKYNQRPSRGFPHLHKASTKNTTDKNTTQAMPE